MTGTGAAPAQETLPSTPAEKKAIPPSPGGLSSWKIDTLPRPPPFNLKNLLRTIGPGAILLVVAIGGGEWLVGPAAAIQYGTSILGLCTLAITLQVIFNLEGIRYTLYTGEPIYVGFMRLKPGPRFWGAVYCGMAFLQMIWPALAAAAAATLFASFFGRLPEAGDALPVQRLGQLLILSSVVLLLFGGTVERMLEKISWVLLGYIFTFLLVVNLLFVPTTIWWETFRGFFQLSLGEQPLDWILVGALVASSGAGGGGNLTITNWIRDKGFGMGSRVGAIPSAVGGRDIRLSNVGTVFEVNADNLRNWTEWLRYVHADQIWLWGLGAFVGMFLCVNLTVGIVPAGTDLSGLAAGAFQAEYMARIWSGFWMLGLLNGFWILFSSHLSAVDVLVRTITDILWAGSARVRRWKGGNVRIVYYSLLIGYALFALFIIRLAPPLTLFKITANIGGFMLAFAGVQILLVNRKLLPREIQPSLWRQGALVVCVLFYGFVVICVLASWLL